MVIYNSVRALFSEAVDYAGSLPSGDQETAAAVRQQLAFQKGVNGWAVGRFALPAARLQELPKDAAKTLRVTALVGNLEVDLPLAEKAGVDTIELKAGTPAQIRTASEKIPASITAYYEIALAQDPRKCIEAIAEAGGCAKGRVGGTAADLFPGSRDLARFLEACIDQNVAFKLVDGMQHAVRGSYQQSGESFVMHGFLNVLLAAAFVRAGMEPVQVVKLLEDQSSEAFHFASDRIGWRDESLETDQIADARTNVIMAFGVADFAAVMAELKALKAV